MNKRIHVLWMKLFDWCKVTFNELYKHIHLYIAQWQSTSNRIYLFVHFKIIWKKAFGDVFIIEDVKMSASMIAIENVDECCHSVIQMNFASKQPMNKKNNARDIDKKLCSVYQCYAYREIQPVRWGLFSALANETPKFVPLTTYLRCGVDFFLVRNGCICVCVTVSIECVWFIFQLN